jgi:hypothetical protein
MNSVLIATDFSAVNDDVKFLEMNTDMGISDPMVDYFDFASLFNYITSNNFTKLHLVYKELYTSNTFIEKIKLNCSNNNIAYNETITQINAILIPDISDETDTLVVRLAYNSQAILDDIYCRDKSELIKVIFDNNLEEYIPKTYSKYNDDVSINDNLDTLNDNDIIPNLIAKRTLPDTFKQLYPAFFNLTSVEDLNNLKSSLEPNILLQEYTYNSNNVIDSTIVNHVRSWYLLTNGLSTVIDCGGYIGANSVQIEENLITYTNNKLDNVARSMFFSNPGVDTNSNGIPSNYLIKVKQNDDSFLNVTAENVQLNDVIEAINIETLDPNFTQTETINWSYTGSIENLISYTTASVISVIDKPVEDWFVRIDYTSGSSLLPVSKLVLVEKDDVVKFKRAYDLDTNDVIFNSSNNVSNITSISNEYYSGSMTIIDIDPSDVFIAGNETNEIMNTIIVHNYGKMT